MRPLGHGERDIPSYMAHDQRIDNQIGSMAPDRLVAGHKKDIVIPARDGRVAIYGGNYANGNNVQSYSNVHGDFYEDYSHGARLFSQDIMIDGRSVRLSDALANPTLRGLLTDHTGGSFGY